MQPQDERSALLGDAAEEKAVSQNIDQSKGARPKIRNPKEAKRRRFVMKQAKTISKPQPLESVSESEESQNLLGDPSASGQRNKTQEFFGVRSYVHTFYEAMAMDNPHAYEETFGHSAPVKKRRKQVLCWRLLLASGLLILLMGIVSLCVGFLVPKKKEVVDVQEDLEIVDRSDQAFNRDLDVCKVVGVALFCVGGLVVAAVFFAVTFTWKHRMEDPLASEEIPLTAPEMVDREPGPIDVKVPVTEEVKAVQPKRVDPEEVVMTNAGLCKIP